MLPVSSSTRPTNPPSRRWRIRSINSPSSCGRPGARPMPQPHRWPLCRTRRSWRTSPPRPPLGTSAACSSRSNRSFAMRACSRLSSVPGRPLSKDGQHGRMLGCPRARSARQRPRAHSPDRGRGCWDRGGPSVHPLRAPQVDGVGVKFEECELLFLLQAGEAFRQLLMGQQFRRQRALLTSAAGRPQAPLRWHVK